ncbi:MAG TPA: hypothetical protein DCX07_14200 [Phycisphaerales bacterium]|nr:hypothetical protein [Phycisphaerales bacterium]
MSLSCYIDAEVPSLGEWSSVVQSGNSTFTQTPLAAWPGRGKAGFRCATVSGSAAYGQANGSFAPAAGGDCFVAFWFRIHQTPSGGYAGILASEENEALIYLRDSRRLECYFRNDAGGYPTAVTTAILSTGVWYHLAFRVHRAATAVSADGYGQVYIDGLSAGQTANMDNYDRAEVIGLMRFGASVAVSTALNDFDEIKIGTALADVEPFSPAPLTDYSEPRRTVLIVPNTANGRTFAADCFAAGIPRANVCCLPTVGAETLADYATFQAQVETPLANFLAARPVVAGRVTTFLIGPGVPGFFVNGGVTYSATSRLMHYGTAFSADTANPLYAPGTVARPTISALRAASVYLCTRIDADTIAPAQDILAAGLALSVQNILPESDVLYTDDPIYGRDDHYAEPLLPRSSSLAEIENTALVAADDSTVQTLHSTGSRAVFVSRNGGSCPTLRSASCWPAQAILNCGFAAALGFADTPCDFRVDAFVRMLLAGGSVAEAFAVAVAKLDHTSVAVGWPCLTVGFPKRGRKIYAALGGLEAIDFDQPLAYARADQNTLSLPLPVSDGQKHVLLARNVSASGVEERNTHALAWLELDVSGEAAPLAPPAPFDLSAEIESPDTVLLGFSWRAEDGWAEAECFEVFADTGDGFDLENPIATADRPVDGQGDFETRLDGLTLPAWLAVRAVGAGRAGDLSAAVLAPAGPDPQAPELL